jgi:hypothetical protein
MSDAKKLAQLALAAVTAEVHDDRAAADEIYDELALEDPQDVARTIVGMTTALLHMVGPEAEPLLRELAKWIAET